MALHRSTIITLGVPDTIGPPKEWQGREVGPPAPATFLEPHDLAALIAAG